MPFWSRKKSPEDRIVQEFEGIRISREHILKMHKLLLNANDDKKAWEIVQDVMFETRATGLTCEEWTNQVLRCAKQRKADFSVLYISMTGAVYQDAFKKEHYDKMKSMILNNYVIAAKPTSEEQTQAKDSQVQKALEVGYLFNLDKEKKESSPML